MDGATHRWEDEKVGVVGTEKNDIGRRNGVETQVSTVNGSSKTGTDLHQQEARTRERHTIREGFRDKSTINPVTLDEMPLNRRTTISGWIRFLSRVFSGANGCRKSEAVVRRTKKNKR